MTWPPSNAGAEPTPPRAGRQCAARFLAPAAVAVLFFCAGAQGAQEKEKEQKPEAAAAQAAPAENKPAEYVGSQACQVCHEDIFNGLQKSPHCVVETGKKRGWEGKACEACHGPGSRHAESASAAEIRNPSKLPAAQTDRTCLNCHLNEPTHVGRIQSSHAKNQVSCTGCHSIHKNGPGGLVARKATAVNELCAKCHTGQWAQFQRPFKHRLPEGAMSCVDCHNPHGTLLARSIQTSTANEPGCFKCHSDKRGPFTFEHAPVKLEGCTACHEPHGSANPRMLARQEVRLLCLECHSNIPAPQPPANVIGGVTPPAFHDLRSPRYRNCTICHFKVHGSYVQRDLLR